MRLCALWLCVAVLSGCAGPPTISLTWDEARARCSSVFPPIRGFFGILEQCAEDSFRQSQATAGVDRTVVNEYVAARARLAAQADAGVITPDELERRLASTRG